MIFNGGTFGEQERLSFSLSLRGEFCKSLSNLMGDDTLSLQYAGKFRGEK
jgi:hypothetical protein